VIKRTVKRLTDVIILNLRIPLKEGGVHSPFKIYTT